MRNGPNGAPGRQARRGISIAQLLDPRDQREDAVDRNEKLIKGSIFVESSALGLGGATNKAFTPPKRATQLQQWYQQ